MPKMIFVNLPVTDVAKSTAFYEALGAVKNPQFSNEESSCMVVSDTIFVMLLNHRRFGDFAAKPIADAHRTTEVLLCLTEESRADVDARVETAVKAGGKPDPTPTQDHGLMYGRSYEDPDGHIWEVVWMDPAAVAGDAFAVEPA